MGSSGRMKRGDDIVRDEFDESVNSGKELSSETFYFIGFMLLY